MNKPQINKTEVLRVATAQLAQNGTTSSKEVKDQLRAENFEARQNEVSVYLQQIAQEENYHAEVKHAGGNTYNQYSLQPVQASAPTAAVTQPQTTTADPGILSKVLDSIYNIFGYKAGANDKFETGQITSSSDMSDLLNDLAPQFSLDKQDFDSEFDPGAVIIWRDKTPTDLALFIGTLTNVAAPVTPQPVAPTTFVTNATAGKTRKPYTRVNANPIFVATSVTTLADICNGHPKNSWILYSTAGTDKAIYDGSMSRDAVRSAYARRINFPIQQVRSRRVSNIVPGVTYKHLN